MVNHCLVLAPEQGRIRAKLYQLGAVLTESNDSDGVVELDVRLSRVDWQRLLSAEQLEPAALLKAG
jgi:GTP-binding protein HflX